MSVRAKFTLQTYETSLQVTGYEPKPDGSNNWERPIIAEVRTLNFTPVSDGSAENKAFFSATPIGNIKLGVVNQVAWEHFELGKSYYVDFAPAE